MSREDLLCAGNRFTMHESSGEGSSLSEPEIKEGIILASRLDSSYTNAVTLISSVDSL